MPRIVPTLRAALLLAILSAPTGCGLKGDLYLPDVDDDAAAAGSPSPDRDSDERDDDEDG